MELNKLSESLMNEAIKSMRLDQAILISENRVLAEALAKFVFSLVLCSEKNGKKHGF
ncbi:MAG: hypothetical protein ISS93_02170 [Candidatus Aenigmarchaeota archaeon]|nr:hypothetical protein [Candidatus Aenigmarchaeota archaeon]